MKSMTPQQFQKKQFQKILLRWFDQAGRKHLPWQQNKTPYRVWISEVMLQQTQVNTVIPYFERFIEQFPDVVSLAHAQEDHVLHLWSGLGYYSRARNLHKAAQIVMETYGGHFPDTADELQSLPGIGESTAGAILAIAFNQCAAILDGNVKRVLTRLHGVTQPINEKQVENHLWTLARHYTPIKRVADYTQAMMDLGATLCTRKKPQCNQCPFMAKCFAHQQGLVEQLPQKKTAKALPIRKTTFLVIKKGKQVLLYKRPAKGIWGGLWSLPEMPGQSKEKAIQAYCQEHFQLLINNVQPLKAFRHTFTHYHLDIIPIIIQVKKTPKKAFLTKEMAEKNQIWYNLAKPIAIGLPKPIQSLLGELT